MAAAGVSGWVFNKLQQRSGYGNNQSALLGTLVVFAITFVVVLTIGLMFLR